jgi:triphosphatase
MAIETELKLRMTPEHLAKLRRHTLFKTHQLAAPVTRRLHNIYFDTPGLELQKHRMALRLRRVGGLWLQTLKGGGSIKAGLHMRNEWEVPVPSASLDFDHLDEAVWGRYLTHGIRSNLQPAFITDFYRSSRIINWQGAQIEVCMDHGEVQAALRSSPICEVELELKSGCPQKLFELAQSILEIVPFELEVVSKAELGYRLLADYTEQPVKAGVSKLAKTDRLTEGLQTLIWSCLTHLQANLRGAMGSGARDSHDDEYLHQMRVALRRLRVVLRIAEKIRADDELASLREALSKLGCDLGRIREWDVFIARTIQPMNTAIDGDVGQQSLKALLVVCERQRADCYDALRQQGRELQGLLLRFAIWMNGSYWLQAELDTPVAGDFASKLLQKLYRRYEKTAMLVDTLDAPRLHALRIDAKKLRYSAEFFAGLYDTRKAKLFLSALGDVQENLGEINDIAVAHRLLDEGAVNSSAHQEVIAFIRGSIDRDLSLKIKLLSKTIHKFGKQRVFWEK